ncbi:MAG: hypothetical protein GEU79_14470 [Acidimicrobiia bacterium]|nr:hypothetical protein [Acidimicrobiia bacterium]
MATVRRVRRIIRKIDPWTVLKTGAVVFAVAAIAIVLGVIIGWSIIVRAGIPDAITELLVQVTLLEPGDNPFANTEQFTRFVVFGALVWWAVTTGFAVLLAVIYNLTSDVVGGLEVVVLEESLNPPESYLPEPEEQHEPSEEIEPVFYGTSDDVYADEPTEETEPVRR